MDKEILQEHHEGLIALSGCLSGEIPYLIGQKDMDGAMAWRANFRRSSGRNIIYLEVQANGLEHQRVANSGLLEMHKKLDIPLAGTNDCHYLKKEDFAPARADALPANRQDDQRPNRMKFDTDQLYVKSTEEVIGSLH